VITKVSRKVCVGSFSIFLLGCSSAAVHPNQESLASFSLIGNPEVLDVSFLPNARWVPDGNLPFLNNEEGFVAWFSAGSSTYRAVGNSFARLQLSPSAPITNRDYTRPEDNGEMWLYSVFKNTGSHGLISFYHSEDQLWNGELKNDADGSPMAYKSIKLAISDDNGIVWKKLGAILTHSAPKPNTPQWSGIGDHCAIAHDGYYWIYYSKHFIHLARSPLASGGTPGTWMKFYDDGKSEGFSEPGLGGRESPIFDIPGENPSVIFDRKLRKYVMAFHTHGRASNMMVTYSDDGIHWQKPRTLMTSNGQDAYRFATLFENSSDNDGDNKEDWIYFGYWPNNQVNKRQLRRQKIALKHE
jgi:hypothetical protein